MGSPYEKEPSQPGKDNTMARRGSIKVDLLIVDPNNDFMGNDDGSPYSVKLADGKAYTATLPVQGAVSDAMRASALIRRIGPKLHDIHVTLDSHHPMHIAHPDMWRDGNGKPPAPFTLIRSADMKADMWRARNPLHQRRMYKYLVALEATGRLHCIWPPHCLIGSWGHNVQIDIFNALTEWERSEMGVLDVVTKGSSVWTEHFGGLMAEVPDPNDPSTQLNTGLITTTQEADLIGVLGWASSHCLKRTAEQLADNIGDAHIKKMVLITDCMSPVPAIPGVDFPAIAAQFLNDMEARGMKLAKADDFLR